MSSIREQILAEIATRAAAVAGIGGRAYRSRNEAVARGEMPCLVVAPISDTAQPIGGMCKTDRQLTVNIAILLHADIPDQAADPISVDLHSRLILSGDTTLGGRAIDIEQIGDDFQFAATDGVIIHSYRVWYRHSTFALDSP